MKSNITLEVFESIVIEQLKERGYNTKIVEKISRRILVTSVVS